MCAWVDHNTRDAHLNFGDRGERVSWLLETVQSASDGFKRIDGPSVATPATSCEDYVAKLQIDSDPARPVYQSLRIKVGLHRADSPTRPTSV